MDLRLTLPSVLKWLAIASFVGALAGTASAGFLVSLDAVTRSRETHPGIILLLPLAGFAIGWMYHRFGRAVEAGNNLIIDEIHDPRAVIPLRMAPLVLLGTLATHLFGGSAGREGTAVQMGASLADRLTGPLRLASGDRRILLMAGMSAGFASVFGTPLAGAVFGLEVLTIGRMRYDAIFPCFIAAVTGHLVTLAWGVGHTRYPVEMGALAGHLSIAGLLSALVAGAIFGVTGSLFAAATHRISALARRFVPYPPLRPALGAVLIVAATGLIGSTRYLGLGIPVIVASFAAPGAPWDFAAKFAFTAWTLGTGFKGGEVTPLFFIGATLGNALAYVLPLPTSLLAGMGFTAVFAGAANVPLASILLAVELFGPEPAIYAALACVVSYLCSGHSGIYRSQRIAESKAGAPLA